MQHSNMASRAASDFLPGFDSPTRHIVRRALQAEELILPPVVLTEPLLTPSLEVNLEALLRSAALLPVLDGYWDRAALNRRVVLAHGLKARLADTLIAQACVDRDIPFDHQ